jgi:nucleoside-triphosphatase
VINESDFQQRILIFTHPFSLMPYTSLLLTGHPGVGKTTIIKRILAQLACPAGGFYTEEVRENGRRNGFKIVTLDGRAGMLAHVNIRSPYRIGQYGVDLTVVDKLAVDSIRRAAAGQLIIMDEIGPMELFSDAFCQTVIEVLGSGAPVLGTIVKRRHPVADAIKALPNVALIEVTIENRDTIVDNVAIQWKNQP